MIQTETFILDGRELVRTWSDRNMLIHGGFPETDYVAAVDPAEMGRTYTETNIPIEDDSTESDKAEAYDILIGGAS